MDGAGVSRILHVVNSGVHKSSQESLGNMCHGGQMSSPMKV